MKTLLSMLLVLVSINSAQATEIDFERVSLEFKSLLLDSHSGNLEQQEVTCWNLTPGDCSSRVAEIRRPSILHMKFKENRGAVLQIDAKDVIAYFYNIHRNVSENALPPTRALQILLRGERPVITDNTKPDAYCRTMGGTPITEPIRYLGMPLNSGIASIAGGEKGICVFDRGTHYESRVGQLSLLSAHPDYKPQLVGVRNATNRVLLELKRAFGL